MLDIGANALKAGNELTLFLVVEDVLRVEDRGCFEGVGASSRVLLQCFIGEDSIKLFAESHVVDKTAVRGQSKVLLKTFEFNRGQVDSLGEQGASELLSREVALAEDVVILEELRKTNTVLLHDLFNLGH